jgi:hypothetical protein
MNAGGMESYSGETKRAESVSPLENIRTRLGECEGFVDSLEQFDMMSPAITEQEENMRTKKLSELRERCDEALAQIMALIDALDPAASRDTLMEQISALSKRVSAA